MPPTTPLAHDLDPARAPSQGSPEPRRVHAAHWVLDSNDGVDEPVPYRLAETRS